MSISVDTIKKIAELARLELTSQETELYSKQLTAILDYVSQLSKVNTEGVKPLVTPSDMIETVREDQVIEGFQNEAAVTNAPDRSGNLYKVPPVL